MVDGILDAALIVAARLWDWAGAQDGRTAFLVGVGAWFLAERAMGLVNGLILKLIVLKAILVALLLGSAFYVEGRKVWAEGETIPLESKVKTPNADYFSRERK